MCWSQPKAEQTHACSAGIRTVPQRAKSRWLRWQGIALSRRDGTNGITLIGAGASAKIFVIDPSARADLDDTTSCQYHRTESCRLIWVVCRSCRVSSADVPSTSPERASADSLYRSSVSPNRSSGAPDRWSCSSSVAWPSIRRSRSCRIGSTSRPIPPASSTGLPIDIFGQPDRSPRRSWRRAERRDDDRSPRTRPAPPRRSTSCFSARGDVSIGLYTQTGRQVRRSPTAAGCEEPIVWRSTSAYCRAVSYNSRSLTLQLSVRDRSLVVVRLVTLIE